MSVTLSSITDTSMASFMEVTGLCFAHTGAEGPSLSG